MPLNAIQHLDAADHLVSLMATAIRLHHPQSIRMASIRLGDLLNVPDAKIIEATERLTAWIAAQPGVLTGATSHAVGD